MCMIGTGAEKRKGLDCGWNLQDISDHQNMGGILTKREGRSGRGSSCDERGGTNGGDKVVSLKHSSDKTRVIEARVGQGRIVMGKLLKGGKTQQSGQMVMEIG